MGEREEPYKRRGRENPTVFWEVQPDHHRFMLRVNTSIYIGTISHVIAAIYDNSGRDSPYDAYIYPPHEPPFAHVDGSSGQLVEPNYSYRLPLTDPANRSAAWQQVVAECKKKGYIPEDVDVGNRE